MNTIFIYNNSKLGPYVTLHLKHRQDSLIKFRSRIFAPFHKLMAAYADYICIPEPEIRFKYHGVPINTHNTPAELQMSKDDVIDTYIPLTGGGRKSYILDKSTKLFDDQFRNKKPNTDQNQTKPQDNFIQYIHINVLGTDNSTTKFRIKNTTPIYKVINEYCEMLDLNKETLHFRFDGQAICRYHTPIHLEMSSKEPNTIEVFHQQVGGGNETNDPPIKYSENFTPIRRPQTNRKISTTTTTINHHPKS